MQYFLIDEKLNKYVEVDETTDKARVFIKGELEKQTLEAKARLNKIPDPVPDSELLAWAKLNHPMNMDYSKEREILEKLIADNKAILKEI